MGSSFAWKWKWIPGYEGRSVRTLFRIWRFRATYAGVVWCVPGFYLPFSILHLPHFFYTNSYPRHLFLPHSPVKMRFPNFLTFLPALTLVSAHGRITNITTSSGTVYTGWDPEFALQSTPAPALAAWSASNLGNIFVPPSSFNTSNTACHFNSTPGALHVNTTAGDTLKLQWNEWPVSHKGPVLTYLAACSGSCATAKKEELKWVKIDELGWLNSSGYEMLGGTWASDVLIANGFAWVAKVPDGLAPGDYVLRHEILALHVADLLDGAQSYPQCVNIKVGGTGSKKVEGGVLGNQLYKPNDKGILVDIHKKIDGYEIPGPKLWAGATSLKQPNEKRWRVVVRERRQLR
jgi:cellulase